MLLVLFTVPTVNLSPSSDAPAIGDESQSNELLPIGSPVLAVDGDESPASITSFYETSADDVFLMPDSDTPDGFNEVDSSSVMLENNTDVLFTTGITPTPLWRRYRKGGYDDWGGANGGADLIEMWANKSSGYSVCDVEFAYYMKTGVVPTTNHLAYVLLKFEVASHYRIGFYTVATDTEYYTPSRPLLADTWTKLDHQDVYSLATTTISRITVEVTTDDPYGAGTNHSLFVDYQALTSLPLDTDSGRYVESFFNIDDWTDADLESGDSMTTDNDLANFTVGADSGDDWDNWYWTIPSIDWADWDYFEIRMKSNDSGLTGYWVLYLADQDSGGSTCWFSIPETTTWQTYRYHKDDFTGAPLSSVERVQFSTRLYTGESLEILVDYFRISPANETGFSYDGSTTHAITTGNGGTVSSDGDYLSMIADADSSTFNFAIDTTVNETSYRLSDYQFIEIKIHDSDVGNDLRFRVQYFDDSWNTLVSQFTTTTATIRFNIAIVGTYIKTIQLWGYYSQTTRLDFMKAYSISNFTVGQASGCTTSDIMYVDNDNALVFDRSTINWMSIAYDPTLSVNTATYNVWNITTPDIDSRGDAGYTNNFQTYVVGWENHFDESRGTYSSGTLTNIQLVNYGNTTISAIKFIEDATAPTVIRTRANPPDPTNEETVTISSVVTDSIEVYSVKINAITSPSGFSDVDYSMTEQSDNLWIYTFSSLIDGYYCFKVIASDGANENSLTSDAYIDFTVRKAELDADGFIMVAGSTVQLSGDINMDASYLIYEYDIQVGSGSVSKGAISVSWTRASSTTASDVTVGIKFTNGTLIDWINGTYSKALDIVFKVSTWWMDLDLGGQQPMVEGFVLTSWENATIYVYDNGTLQVTVTEGEGGVFFYWWMSESMGLHEITFNITSGSTTFTKTRTYYIPDWAVSGLNVRLDIMTFQDNYTLIQLESTWRNCTYSIYLNGSLIATAAVDPTTLNITRPSNVGEYNLTIFADGGSQTYTFKNIRYIVTEEGVTYDYSTLSGGVQYITEEGDTYEGDTIEGIPPQDMAMFVISVVGIVFMSIFLGGVIMWWENKKEKQRDFRAAISGGN